MKSIKEFISNFKEFLLASTFIDVAIGLLIAGAVKDVATSFTDSFVNPIISHLLEIVGLQGDSAAVTVFGIDFLVSDFISALVSFAIIMFVAFSILEFYAKMKEKFIAENEEEVTLSNEEVILAEIRDLLKDVNETKENSKKD